MSPPCLRGALCSVVQDMNAENQTCSFSSRRRWYEFQRNVKRRAVRRHIRVEMSRWSHRWVPADAWSIRWWAAASLPGARAHSAPLRIDQIGSYNQQGEDKWRDWAPTGQNNKSDF